MLRIKFSILNKAGTRILECQNNIKWSLQKLYNDRRLKQYVPDVLAFVTAWEKAKASIKNDRCKEKKKNKLFEKTLNRNFKTKK